MSAVVRAESPGTPSRRQGIGRAAVMIGAYAGFGVVGGAYVNRLGALPLRAEYLLSGGTTLGVLALAATAVVPAWRLGVGSRPTLRFPPGVGPRVMVASWLGAARPWRSPAGGCS